MSKPTEVSLTKKDQKTILGLFKKGITNCRTLAKEINSSRREVMFFLESQGLMSYSEGSYN